MNRGSSSNESSGMQMSRRRHKLPLITCTECGKHTVGEYEVKTDMKGNKGRIFFTCPARKVLYLDNSFVNRKECIKKYNGMNKVFYLTDILYLFVSLQKRDGSGCPFWYWEEDYEKIVEKQKNKKDKHSESSPDNAIHDEDTARSASMQVSHDIEQIVKSNFEQLNKTLQNLVTAFWFFIIMYSLLQAVYLFAAIWK